MIKLNPLKYTVLILVTSLFASCVTPELDIPRNNFVIPDSIMSFFPHLQDSSKHSSGKLVDAFYNSEPLDKPYIPSEFEVLYICLIYKYDSDQLYLNRKNDLRLKSKRNLASEESEYNIISSEEHLLKLYSINDLVQIFNLNNDFFLPNFREVFQQYLPFDLNDNTNCGLPADFQIYVLEHDFANVIEESYAYNWNLLPESIKQGYTSGVAVNDSKALIVYWAVAW
ncbi:MAG: hypothetical protein KAG64_00195 [Bacteroidales bacterium]|nr:hypothetical protein [Bacteroidales bacterium]